MQLTLGRTAQSAILIGAALLEVAGDALIRRGMRGGGVALFVVGLTILASYGVLVNVIDLDFSKVLGAYVGVFAIVSVLVGRFAFRDQIPLSTWAGLAVILCGSLIIQLGRGR